jgi:hypothetical protein
LLRAHIAVQCLRNYTPINFIVLNLVDGQSTNSERTYAKIPITNLKCWAFVGIVVTSVKSTCANHVKRETTGPLQLKGYVASAAKLASFTFAMFASMK